MKEFLTIGQFAVSRSFLRGEQGEREVQRHASFQFMHEPSLGPAYHNQLSGNLELHRVSFISQHQSRQGPEPAVSSRRGFIRLEDELGGLKLSNLLECEMQFRCLEQLYWIYAAVLGSSPEETKASRETFLRAHLLRDRHSISHLPVDSKSISDWAELAGMSLHSLFVSNPEEDHSSSNPASKRLASFLCRTAAVSGDTAYVTALNESTGERFEAECETSLLCQKGIQEGTEFLCTVARKGEQTILEFAPLPPKILTAEELEDISAEVDSRLK